MCAERKTKNIDEKLDDDFDINVDFEELKDVEVEGGFDGENDDSCPDGACKI